MELINSTPFQFAPIAGRLNYPEHSLTYIIKGTFDLHPNHEATISDEQLLTTGDEYYPEDEEQKGSIRYESDFAYFKPHGELTVIGKCYAPQKQAVRACPISIQVGNAKKSLIVFGNRYWKKILLNPETTEPVLFSEMDLRYERSFGGADFEENPVGRGFCKADVTVADNVLPVPNIQDPDDLITSPYQKKTPAGFGPINRDWLSRLNKMGSYDKHYLKKRWPWFPEDFDWQFFNAAPRDQQIKGYFSGDESLSFENLHPQHSLYHTKLPGIRIRCFNRRIDPATRKKIFEEVDIKLDTIWVDMLAEKMVLVWRGWGPIIDEDFDEIRHIFLMAEPLSQEPASVSQYHELFLEQRKKIEDEWQLAPEEPEPVSKDEALKVKTAEALEITKPKIDAETIIEQMQSLLSKLGISLSELPEETQQEIKQNQIDLINSVNDDSHSTTKDYEQSAQQQLKASLAELNIELDNISAPSAKAVEEQQSSLNEFGLGETNLTETTDGKAFMGLTAALFSQMGFDPEDLSSFIEQNKTEIENLKKQLPVKPNASGEIKQSTKGSAAEEEKLKIQQRITAGESLAGEDFSGQDLSGLKLCNIDISNALFAGTNLTNTDLSGSKLCGANFSQADLSHATMKNCDCSSADFSNANLASVDAQDSDFTAAILSYAKMNQANLTNTNFNMANLSRTYLQKTLFTTAKLNNADFTEADLADANLERSELNDTNFEKSHAKNSQWSNCEGKDTLFVGADLDNSNFQDAILNAADFSHAILTNANFANAKLAEASFEAVNAENIIFFKADISKLRASEFSNFSLANLSQSIANESIWEHANLQNADLSYAQMEKANFSKATLKEANLFAVNMKQARFLKADLSQANMTQMNLMQGSLERANLTQTNLSDSNLYGVEFLNAHLEQTNFAGSNLKSTKLQETV